MKTYYDLVCTQGEAEGDQIPIDSKHWALVTEFLRAQLEWNIASATNSITWEHDQPVFVRYQNAQMSMVDRFKMSKWQVRSVWELREVERER